LEINAQDDDEEDCDGSGSGWTADDCLRAGADQARAGRARHYDNKYEVYGGLNFMNFMAGQDLTRRMDFGGGELEGTYWLTRKWGLAAEYRGEAGTTPVLPMQASTEFTARWCIATWCSSARSIAGCRTSTRRSTCTRMAGLRMASSTQGPREPAGKSTEHSGADRSSCWSLRQPHGSDLRAGRQRGHEPVEELAVRLSPDLILDEFGSGRASSFAISGGIVYRIPVKKK